MQAKTTSFVIPVGAFWEECHFPDLPLMPGVLLIKAIREASGLGGYWENLAATFRRALKPGDRAQLCFNSTSPHTQVDARVMADDNLVANCYGSLSRKELTPWPGTVSTQTPAVTEKQVQALLPMTGTFRLVRDLLVNNHQQTTTGRLVVCPDWAHETAPHERAMVWAQEALLEGANQVAALVMIKALAFSGVANQIPVLTRLEGVFEANLPLVGNALEAEILVDVSACAIRGRRQGTGKVRIYSHFPMAGQKPGQTFYEGSVTASLMPAPQPTEAATA